MIPGFLCAAWHFAALHMPLHRRSESMKPQIGIKNGHGNRHEKACRYGSLSVPAVKRSAQIGAFFPLALSIAHSV